MVPNVKIFCDFKEAFIEIKRTEIYTNHSCSKRIFDCLDCIMNKHSNFLSYTITSQALQERTESETSNKL